MGTYFSSNGDSFGWRNLLRRVKFVVRLTVFFFTVLVGTMCFLTLAPVVYYYLVR